MLFSQNRHFFEKHPIFSAFSEKLYAFFHKTAEFQCNFPKNTLKFSSYPQIFTFLVFRNYHGY